MLQAAAVAVALASPAVAGAAPAPAQIVLRLNDSDFEFRGTLKSFDGEKYVLESSSFGVLSLTAAKYTCEGESCNTTGPKLATASSPGGTLDFAIDDGAEAKRFAIHGPASISRELMPALIQDYAKSIGGAVSQLVGSDPTTTEYKLFDSKGTLLAQIGLQRSSPAEAFISVASKRADIAVSTRPALATEAASLARIAPAGNPAENEHIIALDGTAVVVPPGSKAAALPIKTIAGIFTGQIKDWSGAGLQAGPINVYVAADGAGGTDGLDTFFLERTGGTLTPSAKRLASEVEVSDAVARDPNGIGLTSHALLRNAKAIGVTTPCGITSWPSEFAIKSEEYPLSRRVYLYTAGTPAVADAARLVKFTSSDVAQLTIGSSLFMNQTVVSASSADESSRIAGWIENGGAAPAERELAGTFLTQVKDARRLSLTFRFAMGSSLLDAKARDDLNRLVSLLSRAEFKDKVILLAGFTDSVGSPAANARLSTRRAEQVLDAILEVAPRGSLERTRIRTAGFGAIAPVVCNDEDAGSTKNRRVEVWIFDKAPATATLQKRPEPEVERRKTR